MHDADTQQGTSSHGVAWLSTHHSALRPGYLHLVIPASKPDVNLCKTVVSAAVLGYPPPSLLNWNVAFDDPGLVAGGSHIGKITGMQAFLQDLDASRGDDLVLLVDGYDVWFQLGPQVLLNRYFEINKGAAATSHFLNKGTEAQNVVFSAQKRCWPGATTDPQCSAVPESPLPPDVYGPLTDKELDDERRKYTKIRQRYLNSGFGLGRVDAMLSIFQEAGKIAETNKNFGSDQQILAELFGRQELMRRSRWKWPGSLLFSSSQATEKVDEFGLGLDYKSELSLATVFAEEDTEWIRFANSSMLTESRLKIGMAQDSTVPLSLQSDIEGSLPPFRSTVAPSIDSGWSDVPLLTNVWTGITPAIIHHNAHRDGMKDRREKWWHKIWFQSRAKELLDLRQREPAGPMAFADERFWWPSEIYPTRVRVQIDGGWRNVPLSDVCSDNDLEQVFNLIST